MSLAMDTKLFLSLSAVANISHKYNLEVTMKNALGQGLTIDIGIIVTMVNVLVNIEMITTEGIATTSMIMRKEV
uniref:Hypotheticial protein n=1 Tax=Schistosoma japonicum TaxID=6182 RepID=C1LGI4_SCHJA|nr:hypotheticial protein [Schistosoma japonicum]